MTSSIYTLLYADVQSGPRKVERTAAEKEGEICYTTPEAVSFQDIEQEGIL